MNQQRPANVLSSKKIKTGRAEIVCLLNLVFEKYESTTQNELIRNTNKKNYEEIARLLSEISNQLPNTAEQLGHEAYAPDRNKKDLNYPYLKYDITGGQVRDAYHGTVNRPRPFLVEACYIYLYGVSRNNFEKNPIDARLFEESSGQSKVSSLVLLKRIKKQRIIFSCITLAIVILFSVLLYVYQKRSANYATLKRDLNIVPHLPDAKQIAALEGIWLVYIGSPQARLSDNNRYHQIVNNIVDVKYKDGYFTFKRYGANFNHIGYMQYESPSIVSIHSYLKGNGSQLNSPRLSLLRFDKVSDFYSVISASWNFDVGNNNDVIGIREVYIKKGNVGDVEEITNTVENSSCKCKIIKWKHENKTDLFYLKNVNLESIDDQNIAKYLDENSILLRDPHQNRLLLKGDTTKNR